MKEITISFGGGGLKILSGGVIEFFSRGCCVFRVFKVFHED